MPELHVNKANMIHTTLPQEQESWISNGTFTLHIFSRETQMKLF